jgi:hypothetical protein
LNPFASFQGICVFKESGINANTGECLAFYEVVDKNNAHKSSSVPLGRGCSDEFHTQAYASYLRSGERISFHQTAVVPTENTRESSKYKHKRLILQIISFAFPLKFIAYCKVCGDGCPRVMYKQG